LLEPGKSPISAEPTRTPITLVFTDVVGSSAAKRAAALHPNASRRDRTYLVGIQAKHLRLVRAAVAEYSGKEIMTIGDSFFLTFENPVDALRCSTAIQRRLYAFPIDTPSGTLQLRIGIHTGTAEYFENSWHGTDVDIAARAQSAASAEQILVTEAAREAIGDAPLSITFHPLGTFALKGVGNVRLWDAGYDGDKVRRAAIDSLEQRRRKRIATNIAVILLVAALAGGAAWRWRQNRVAAILASAAKQAIIVTDFENKTGDPIFDQTLTDAFTAQLEQSPVLKLVSQLHLHQSMKYLGKSPDDPLTPDAVREIGIREGVKAYLAGSIAKLGNDYVVSVSAKDISTGDDIITEETQASNKNHVLGAVARIATAMRRQLGESLKSIEKLDTPLGQATTPSLEAFRAYALGDVEHERGRDVPQAEAHYRQAVEIDPNFAMAWARLGVIALNFSQHDKAREYFAKAYELSKTVSERERLYIAGHYYQYGLGDLPRTIATLELATRTYPLDFNNPVNLGIAYAASGQMEQYLSQFEQAAKDDPHAAIAQDDVMGAQLTLDRLADAERTMANMKRLGLDDGTTYVLLEQLLLDFLKGDRNGMQRTLDRAHGRPDQFEITSQLALTQEFEGHYRDARDSWRQAQMQAAALKAQDLEASILLSALSGRASLGQCAGADKELRAALALDKSKDTLKQAAFTAALCDESKVALPLLTDLTKGYPSDTLINAVTVPQSRAALALGAHQPGEALKDLEGSDEFDLVAPGAFLRGLAYLDLHDGQNAITAFRAATQYRGAALLCCQNYPQAQLGLARAYAMAGNIAGAQKAYQEFLTTWKTADPDLAQLAAAKKELVSLR
jgi:eukaryotic-like serine/threonine-protein kinase